MANSKFVQTNHGTFPLKYFFSEGLSTDSGEEVSTREVKKILAGRHRCGGETEAPDRREAHHAAAGKGLQHRPAHRGQIPRATGHSRGPLAEGALACSPSRRTRPVTFRADAYRGPPAQHRPAPAVHAVVHAGAGLPAGPQPASSCRRRCGGITFAMVFLMTVLFPC